MLMINSVKIHWKVLEGKDPAMTMKFSKEAMIVTPGKKVSKE